MLAAIRQGIQVLRRVKQLVGTSEVAAAIGSVDTQVEALGTVIESLATHSVAQTESTRALSDATRRCRTLAKELVRLFLRPIAQLGVVLFKRDPIMREAFSIPQVQDYEGLIAAALMMAERASLHKARFVEKGFHDDFLERLRGAVGELRAALDQRSEQFGRRSAATAGLKEEYGRGRDLVRLIDTMVTPIWESSPSKLAQWRTMSRFIRLSVETAATPAVPVAAPIVTPVVSTPPAPVVTPVVPAPSVPAAALVGPAAAPAVGNISPAPVAAPVAGSDARVA
jgi:hypothetical protein